MLGLKVLKFICFHLIGFLADLVQIADFMIR